MQRLALHPRTALLLAGVLAAAGCSRPQPVTYVLPPAAVVPAGWLAPADARGRFGRLFCDVLPTTKDHAGQSFGECRDWLDLPGAQNGAPPPPLATTYRLLVVGGIFSECLANRVTTLQDARQHMEALKFTTYYVPVSANSSSAVNAVKILEFLRSQFMGADQRPFIAFGHSKGGVDLWDASTPITGPPRSRSS